MTAPAEAMGHVRQSHCLVTAPAEATGHVDQSPCLVTAPAEATGRVSVITEGQGGAGLISHPLDSSCMQSCCRWGKHSHWGQAC